MRIMCKAFGARKRETGETIYDHYPLSRLTELLCFENSDEAREACQHYNITVKDVKSSNGTQQVIFWKKTDFKEPRHPEKGFVLPLRPRKMTRVIESKLNGATRLAICRGEVSGEGASLSGPVAPPVAVSTAISQQMLAQPSIAAAALSEKQQAELKELMEKERKREEEFKRRKAEELRQQKKREAEEKERKRQELERKRQEEARQQRLRAEEDERRRQKEEIERKRLAAEEKKRQEAERERKEEEDRQARERERQQKELDERMRKEEEARLAQERELRAAEEKRRKEEEERRRQEEIKRLEAERRELERKKAEERKKKREWKAKSDKCRRILLWKRWQRRLSRRMTIVEGERSRMKNIDPTFTSYSLDIAGALENELEKRAASEYETHFHVQNNHGPRRIIEQLLGNENPVQNFSSVVTDAVQKAPRMATLFSDRNGRQYSSKTTILLKVAVVLPALFDQTGEENAEIVRLWLGSRLGVGKVLSSTLDLGGDIGPFEVRSAVAFSPSEAALSGCDVAIFVVPPYPIDLDSTAREFQSASATIGEGVPSLALVVGDASDALEISDILANCATDGQEGMLVMHPPNLSTGAYNNALESVCKRAVDLFLEERCSTIIRLPVMKLPVITVIGALWRNVSSRLDSKSILELTRLALEELEVEITGQVERNRTLWQQWPGSEFAPAGEIENYFAESESLPQNWTDSLEREELIGAVVSLKCKLNGEFSDVIRSLLVDAAPAAVEECTTFTSQQAFRKCLEAALTHSLNVVNECDYLYLPSGVLEEIVENSLARADERFDTSLYNTAVMVQYATLPFTDDFVEEIEVSSENLDPSPGNKRLNSEPLQEFLPDSTPNSTRPTPTKRRRLHMGSPTEESVVSRSANIEESAAFSKRLMMLASGDAIVDTPVGDTMLSSLLAGVPALIDG